LITIFISIFCTVQVMCLMGVIYNSYMISRNYKTYLFMKGILEHDYENYSKMPTYETMLYSFKKLNKENWVKGKK